MVINQDTLYMNIGGNDMVKYSIKKHEQLSQLKKKEIYVLWAETEYSCRGLYQGSKEKCEKEKERRLNK